MYNFLRLLTAVVVLGGALAAFILIPVRPTPPSEALPADWQPEPGHGEYVMYASDCRACHTVDDGADFAGGRAIESPLGTIRTANITPDLETGIGNWTLDQFRAALVDGIRADGAHLYPAMPYENYRMLTEPDIRALYGYFMEEVPPVRNTVADNDLPFPFDQRRGIRALNWVILRHDSDFTPTMGDEMLDRGQYLVEGPGHCAACHSPRNLVMGQDGITVQDANFLTGGHVDGWNAPSLRGPGSAVAEWPIGELTAYLATARNAWSTANGEMGLVVEHSLQHLTGGDILAMAAFLKALDADRPAPPSDPPAMPVAMGPLSLPPEAADAAGEATARMLTEAEPGMPLGARLYLDNCSACHFVTGRGSPEIFPALQGNSLVLSEEARPLISIILDGAEVPGTVLRPMPLVMQGYRDRLSDEEIAELANFLRGGAWGNEASSVSAADVSNLRQQDGGH